MYGRRRNRVSASSRGVLGAYLRMPAVVVLLVVVARAEGQQQSGNGQHRFYPTPELLERAEGVAKQSDAVKAEEEAWLGALTADCQNGDNDSCWVVSRHRSPLLRFTALSDNPSGELQELSRQSRELLGRCEAHHPASCLDLGVLVNVYSGRSEIAIFPLAAKWGLESTLKKALLTDPRMRRRAESISKNVVALLRTKGKPTYRQMKRWLAMCPKRSAAACLLGESVGWESGETPRGKKLRATTLAFGPTTGQLFERARSRYCKTYPSICDLDQGDLSDTEYEEMLHKKCQDKDGRACNRLADGISNSDGADTMARRNQFNASACMGGSPDGCAAMVEPSIHRGNHWEGFVYAFMACQAAAPKKCRQLSKTFAVSRDYTSKEVGRSLLETACHKGDVDSCHEAFKYAFQAGDGDYARQRWGQLCVDANNERACRFASQLEALAGRKDTAIDLLRKGCTDENINSCIELAGLLAHFGETQEAMGILRRECDESAGPHPCKVLRRLEAGHAPHKLNEIYQQPVDDSPYSFVE